MIQRPVIRAFRFVGTLLLIGVVLLIAATIINRVAPEALRTGPSPRDFLLLVLGLRLVSGLIYTGWNRYRNKRSAALYSHEPREAGKRLAVEEGSTFNNEEYDYLPRKRKLSEEE